MSYLEGQLQIFSTPDVEPWVVGSQPLKELSVDGKQAAGHGGRVHSLGCVGVPGSLTLRHCMPVELKKKFELLLVLKMFLT